MADLAGYIRSHLKPRHFKLLIALDDLRHVGRAAASANVTQPAISKSLAELERGLGLKLFERTTRGVTPTVYGECLIRHARTMVTDLGLARDELHQLVHGTAGRVSVGALSAQVQTLLPQAIALLKKRAPTTNVILWEGSVEALLGDLWQGKADLIVGRIPNNRSSPYLDRVVLSNEPLALVARARHPLAQRRRLRWSDVGRYPWVLPPITSLLRELVERAFSRHAIPMPADHVETTSVPAICSYLQLSDAISIVGGQVARHYMKQGLMALLPLEFSELVPSVEATWSRDRALSSSARLLVECLQQAATDSVYA